MIEKTLSVWPAGVYGMSKLATFLENIRHRHAISDWHPGPWVDAGRERVIIRFDNEKDANHAKNQWEEGRKHIAGLTRPNDLPTGE
jgi:hypothetical protein